jgi:hypothetical protein
LLDEPDRRPRRRQPRAPEAHRLGSRRRACGVRRLPGVSNRSSRLSSSGFDGGVELPLSRLLREAGSSVVGLVLGRRDEPDLAMEPLVVDQSMYSAERGSPVELPAMRSHPSRTPGSRSTAARGPLARPEPGRQGRACPEAEPAHGPAATPRDATPKWQARLFKALGTRPLLRHPSGDRTHQAARCGPRAVPPGGRFAAGALSMVGNARRRHGPNH